MSLYQKVVAGLLFPLHEKLKSHDTIAVHKAMEQSQWLTPVAMAELQLANLRRFLSRIGGAVPYYEKLFAELDFRPEQVTSISDLQRLPLLDKATIRAHTEAMKARDARNLKRFNTGGSSGEPLIFYLGNERVSHDVAAKRRATRWWGVDIGDPEIVVWGSPIELGTQDRLRLLRDGLLRTRLLAAFEMSERKLDEFIATIRRTRPRMLFGYPSALAHVAQRARERGQRMDDLGVRVAFVTSERLYDHQREVIEAVFGCPVANGYGGRDAGFIAHACPEGNLHITAEDIIAEIVDPQGQVLPTGQAGEIVVTHMATRDYPFLRYRTGDIGVLSEAACPCGRGLSLLQSIEGRSTDFVLARDGTVMHGLALIYIVRDIPGVARFKIVQESLDHTRFLLVTTTGFDPTCIATIEHAARERLGAGVRVEVALVPEIPAEASGKFRYVISRVADQSGIQASRGAA